MSKKKTVALVAHDNQKSELTEWVLYNRESLSAHKLVCTGTTGRQIEETLSSTGHERKVKTLKSGPLGGDQQLGAMIAEGKIDVFIFFWDPMSPQPHDVDVKALLRIATMYNVPSACNRATADYIISSPLFHSDYEPKGPDLDGYVNRKL